MTQSNSPRASLEDLLISGVQGDIRLRAPRLSSGGQSRGAGLRIHVCDCQRAIMKWPRRFCCQHASLCSVQNGCSLP
jgi:hypothetical protein